MKKFSFFFFGFLLVSASLAMAQSYSLPGQGYNNIGISAYALVDLNLTLVNEAPFDKFVLLNPHFNYTIYREKGDLVFGANRSFNPTTNMMNYYFGFWIKPYEVLKVNIRTVEPLTVNLTVEDDGNNVPYSRSVTYSGSAVYVNADGTEDVNFFYGTLYPSLILYPQKYYDPRFLMGVDPYIKVLEYDGEVTLVIQDVPDEFGLFREVFAVGVPLLFEDAYMYDFTPEYTMKYSEYVHDFLPMYLGTPSVEREKEDKNEEHTSKTTMFSLTDSLLTGGKVKKPEPVGRKKIEPFDFPVWIVWFGGDRFEISYRVKWTNEERVSSLGGEKEKIRFVLDRRDIR
ncbi:hypothetical protein [Palaeococcus ferrophilus]|uniref:hypothetical protein n=1 Tax=Palaeococcus ferrophilus TaxID=83868 RepID=UPI00064EBEC9|nr:hypothetical protein [Palaeococcus ferrophilus]